MPDVIDRLEKERKVSSRVWNLWTEWSDVDSPSELRKDRLKSAARDSVMPILERQFFDGAAALTSQFGVPLNDHRAAILFLFFFSNWENWLADSWSDRVEKHQSNPDRPPWEFVRGRGRPVKLVDGNWVIEPVNLDPKDPRKVIGAKPVVAPYDADRIAVGSVTNSNTSGELFGWRESERLGDGRIEAYWRTDWNPCKHCAALSDQPSRVWRIYAPNGPMLHEHCRCWLEYFRVLGDRPISSKRTQRVFSMDGIKSRKFFGF